LRKFGDVVILKIKKLCVPLLFGCISEKSAEFLLIFQNIIIFANGIGGDVLLSSAKKSRTEDA